MATDRSPSPALPPPTPSAPGPRATALLKLYNDAITHILKTCSYSNFAACFPTPAQQVPQSVKLLHEQFSAKLGESMRKEFESILDERGVVHALNELDALVEDARKRKEKALTAAAEGQEQPVPAHTLPARRLFISHLAPTLREYEANMRERQKGIEEENLEIMERVKAQRRDIEKLMGGLEGVVGDLRGSVDALGMGGEGVEELKREAKEVDEEMRE